MEAVAEKVETGVAVHRAVGFAPAWEYVAEATVAVQDGHATVREGSHTEDGAVARARAAAGARMTARKRACGFAADGYRTGSHRADFAFGFNREDTP